MSEAENFKKLVEHARKSVLPRGLREEVVRDLEYFCAQALCEKSQRHNHVVLSERFRMLLVKTHGTGHFDRYRSDLGFWRPLEIFVGLAVPPVRDAVQKVPTKKESRYEKMQTEKFFAHLFENAARIKPSLSDTERLMVLFALKYLELEARVHSRYRTPHMTRLAWKTVKPLLERHGLLSEFKDEQILKLRLKSFLEGLIG